jgi:hypothetical protein
MNNPFQRMPFSVQSTPDDIHYIMEHDQPFNTKPTRGEAEELAIRLNQNWIEEQREEGI